MVVKTQSSDHLSGSFPESVQLKATFAKYCAIHQNTYFIKAQFRVTNDPWLNTPKVNLHLNTFLRKYQVLSFIDQQVYYHLPYHTNRMGTPHSRAAARASTPRWTQRAALGLESVSCGAPLWLCQSSLWQCQRGALCQLREGWLQKGLVRAQTAAEGCDGSLLPQSTGKILCHNKPQLQEDWRWESHNEPSKLLQLVGKKE